MNIPLQCNMRYHITKAYTCGHPTLKEERTYVITATETIVISVNFDGPIFTGKKYQNLFLFHRILLGIFEIYR